jgi:hypothetical protein
MRAIASLLLCVSLSSAQSQQTSKEPIPQPKPVQVASANPRYQLVTASIEDGVAANQKTVFLLDTQTGRVWKFQDTFFSTDPSGKKNAQSAVFIPVQIGFGGSMTP